MILIDPPVWPAHGTVFSHLVSDVSLDELHNFAKRQHLSLRAFDMDHYDIPAELYDTLITAGARKVTGTELTRTLIRSGLRVPFKERPHKIRGTLLKMWTQRLPESVDMGEYLLDAWQAPERAYHNSAHLLEMLTHLEVLLEEVPLEIFLAAWFHNIIYTATPSADKQASAEAARDMLAPLVKNKVLSVTQWDVCAQLIEITATHRLDEIESLTYKQVGAFLDADMAILAAARPRYRRYCAGIRAKYSAYSDTEFRAERRAFLQEALERPCLFSTEKARNLWEESARLNIQEELESL
ncbi:DUF4031 domain-containing protein [Rothia sp. ZJ932]|uniref:DUF4031 domain-containing protein n=1 Tax=Rothia sp. ZJ932 TaxID=2810516 RepID=UPI001967B0A1|nr:DUF4031 domain-containing protein [Rothia sp. ZJ932]QRZ61916.1 DUF4031 domain-containing protein [Rothia sp. ZJ932]